MKHCVFRDKDSIYYVDEEGKMVQDSWIYADAGSVTIDGFEEGWYYFGADGKGYRRKNSSFKRNIGGSIYIFDENGKMLSGWFDEVPTWTVRLQEETTRIMTRCGFFLTAIQRRLRAMETVLDKRPSMEPSMVLMKMAS